MACKKVVARLTWRPRRARAGAFDAQSLLGRVHKLVRRRRWHRSRRVAQRRRGRSRRNGAPRRTRLWSSPLRRAAAVTAATAVQQGRPWSTRCARRQSRLTARRASADRAPPRLVSLQQRFGMRWFPARACVAARCRPAGLARQQRRPAAPLAIIDKSGAIATWTMPSASRPRLRRRDGRRGGRWAPWWSPWWSYQL